ncbi:acyl-CoA N-acyltransferase [Radiomyces spectabilis]|uniref:acyl-CoA N-acyltransferase n=1 Tax=Radiomyces spectabilis TaxID=64574 RepID=UPI00221E790F|nr:acyl-CoA N-acyltransferase [Radiomyces spectabilis]KAI8378027.1 acyl-CoA N-acyltransferase [Radiomyces spectabilis]
MLSEEYTFEPAQLADLDRVHQLESSSYHPDEAASRQQLENRIGFAAMSDPALFTVMRCQGNIIGFICSTLTNNDLVTDESMSVHDPQGQTVCLHSVTIDHAYRRRGLAQAILNKWIDELRNVHDRRPEQKYKRIALLSRPYLLPLYESVGFKTLGQSVVQHGPEPWFDCIIDL